MSTSTKRLSSEVLTVGAFDYKLGAVVTDLEKFNIILGQPWLETVNPDIDWTAKIIKHGKTGQHIATAEQYKVPTTVYHLDAAKMAELRKSRGAQTHAR